LLVGEALHRVDEVRDEVGPPLVLVHYLGPGRLDLLVAPLQLVVAAAGQEEGEEHREEEPGFGLVHVRLHGRAACRRWGWRKALSRRPFRPRRAMTSRNIRETRSGLGLRPTPPTDLPMPRPFGILVASDGSPSAQAALDTALAFPWPATSRARGVVALGPLKGFRASTRTALVRAVDETSRALQEALAERWPAAEALALHGAPAEAIVIESRRFRADVVVLGWRGHGRFRRLLAGSVSRSVAEKARCSVLVTRKAPSSVRRLVVGFDGTAASRAALRLAAKLEPPPGGRVFLAQVLEPILVMPRRLPAKTRATVRAELIRKERSRTRDAERG